MISCEVSRKIAIVAWVFIFTTISAPNWAFPQPSVGTAADRQRQLVETIQGEESENGPLAEGLIGPLTALALSYEEEGDRLLWMATIKRVLDLTRANYGPYSLEQVPLIQQLIDYEDTRGNAAAAWDLEQELLTLARRHPDDLRTALIFRKAAEKRMNVLDRYLGGEYPPEIELGCYYDWLSRKDPTGLSNCSSGNRRDVQTALIADAQRHFAEAIAVLLRNDRGGSDDLKELEMDLVKSATRMPRRLFMHRDDVLREPWRSWNEALTSIANWDPADPDSATRLAPNAKGANSRYPTQYGVGRSALQRLYAQEVAAGSWQTQSNALLRVADWDLMHDVYGPALSEYELLYKKLKGMSVAQPVIDEIFSPMTPIVLPTFVPNPLTTDERPESNEYVDVSFEITRLGSSRKVEVLDSSPGVTDSAKDRLVDLIRSSHFRPRTTDGQFQRSSRVLMRYHPSDRD